MSASRATACVLLGLVHAACGRLGPGTVALRPEEGRPGYSTPTADSSGGMACSSDADCRSVDQMGWRPVRR